jgi:hypothetical protein
MPARLFLARPTIPLASALSHRRILKESEVLLRHL